MKTCYFGFALNDDLSTGFVRLRTFSVVGVEDDWQVFEEVKLEMLI
jgi:hypothetical protein